MAKRTADDDISIPLCLVALYWLRTYKILIEADIPQMPANTAQTELSFAREPFLKLRNLSAYDLRIGATLIGADAKCLREALIDAKNTIDKMPTNYIKYPNSADQIFQGMPASRSPLERQAVAAG